MNISKEDTPLRQKGHL